MAEDLLVSRAFWIFAGVIAIALLFFGGTDRPTHHNWWD